MSETTDAETPAEPPSDSDIRRYWKARDHYQPDVLLASVVAAVGRADEGMELTLTVGGSHLSGKVVHRVRWAQLYVEAYPDLEKLLGGIRDHWKQEESENPKSDDDPMPRYSSTIHVVEGQWFSPSGGPLPGDPNLFWRGQLNEIQGWTFGRLSVAE